MEGSRGWWGLGGWRGGGGGCTEGHPGSLTVFDCLVGLAVKASAWGSTDLGSISTLGKDNSVGRVIPVT